MHSETAHTHAIALHPQQPLLVAAHGDAASCRVSCWDYVAAKRTSSFASGGGGSVSSLELLNPHRRTLTLTLTLT